MKTTPAWNIDVVLLAHLHDEEIDVLLTALKTARVEMRTKLEVTLPRSFPEWHPEIRYDMRDGKRLVRASGLLLADGVAYKSADDRLFSHVGMGSDDTTSMRVHFPPVLQVKGTVIPETVAESLRGRHASCVMEHEALQDADLIVDRVHINTRDGVPTGFSVDLPEVYRPLRRGDEN